MSETATETTYADEPYARHRHLRANVGRRRGFYILFIVLALAVLALTFVDIMMLDRQLEYVVYASYGVLAILAILLLFSRRRDVVAEPQEAQPELPRDMERALLQCPECKSVFEYGQIRFHDHKKTAFSCPVCGVYSQMPDLDQEPVKVLRPEGDFKQVQYHCDNCGEDLAVGTFGETPLHLVKFRACPFCGEKGHIVRTGVLPPTPVDEPQTF